MIKKNPLDAWISSSGNRLTVVLVGVYHMTTTVHNESY